MRVLVAPDKFRGTLTARQAAEAVATGWRRTRPEDRLDLAPMADGGEGTMDALVGCAARRGRRASRSPGPREDPVEAAFGIAETTEGRVAIVEMASASGLELLSAPRRDPRLTTTRGTGELIAAALDREPVRLIVGLGGSATNDGGAGMAQALGVRFLDERGREIAGGGARAGRAGARRRHGLDRRLRGVTCVAATDVDNPLTGPAGASAVYGPQKGASADDVVVLDRALAHLAAVVARDIGVDLRDEPGAGAAGGSGVRSDGVPGCARPGGGRRGGRRARAARADGGGRSDDHGGGERSTQDRCAARCRPGSSGSVASSRIPVAIVCGDVEPGLPLEGVTVVSLVERFGRDEALGDARRSLERLAQELAARADELVGCGTGRR